MKKEFQAIKTVAADINKETSKLRAEYLQNVEDSKADLQTAIEAKEAAETEEAFKAAFDKERYAEERAAFYERKLNQFDQTAHIEEAEYDALVSGAESVVNAAANDFRKVAAKAMADIIKARQAVVEAATEADAALEALDRESNFLQSKYAKREFRYLGLPSRFIDDPNEWKNYKVRFNNRIMDIVTEVEPVAVGHNYDPVLLAAWNAAIRADQRG